VPRAGRVATAQIASAQGPEAIPRAERAATTRIWRKRARARGGECGADRHHASRGTEINGATSRAHMGRSLGLGRQRMTADREHIRTSGQHTRTYFIQLHHPESASPSQHA
jgi:hypothetical protein